MGKSKKRKHSRSRSPENHKRHHEDKKEMEKIKNQLNNLEKLMSEFLQAKHKEAKATEVAISNNGERDSPEVIVDLKKQDSTPEKQDENQISTPANVEEQGNEDILKILGDDPNSSDKVNENLQLELVTTWTKWLREGIKEESKKFILNLYTRNGKLYTEAPKMNLEVSPALSEIALKRDKHFVGTQNCVGTAIQCLAAAMSMALDQLDPEENEDEGKFMKYLAHAGQLMTDVFYQQSIARKSFVTPLLSKSIKPTVDATKSDEWLYGTKFAEQVKEAKTVEKACEAIKAPEKSKTYNSKNRNPGNLRHPPAKYRQVGAYPKKPLFRHNRKSQVPSTSSRYQSKDKSRTSRK